MVGLTTFPQFPCWITAFYSGDKEGTERTGSNEVKEKGEGKERMGRDVGERTPLRNSAYTLMRDTLAVFSSAATKLL